MNNNSLSPPQRPLSKKLNSSINQESGTTVKQTPPRGKSSEKTATIVSHYQEPNMVSLATNYM